MKYFLLVSTSVIIFYFSSCRKKEPANIGPQPETASDYLPLKAGNYWIYEQFETDQNGVVTRLNRKDSVYVKGETIINGKTYAMVLDHENYNHDPDSIRYYYFEGDKLFDRTGRTLFSATDFTSVLYEHVEMWGSMTAFSLKTSMVDKGASVTVKAGTFSTVNAKTVYRDENENCELLVLFPIFDVRYAKGVGKVYERLPGNCSDTKKKHRELLRYHLNYTNR